MAFALAKENEAFIERMLKSGRFNNQSEVVREALRRMEREENTYLNSPPLTQQELREIYRPGPQADRQADRAQIHPKGSQEAQNDRRSVNAWEIWTFDPGFGDHPP